MKAGRKLGGEAQIVSIITILYRGFLPVTMLYGGALSYPRSGLNSDFQRQLKDASDAQGPFDRCSLIAR
jgi:hypothetical protein